MKNNILDYKLPDDIKNMSVEELDLFCYAIREFLIDKVSQTGGHLASNLGVVELSVALHYVFDSPRDKIIWDVGHQSYVHKILTGRGKKFDTLRKFEGLSGFPKSKESQHDVFETGHSTTSISAANGFAVARDLKGENYQVIAVIGDGSLTGGMAYEALNNIGASKSKVIVVLNDNGMSISPNIGGISSHLGELRTSKGYLNAKKFVKNRIGAIPNVGKGIAQGLADIKNDIKYSMMDYGGVLFEELGFTYFGPIDGHDITALNKVFKKAKDLDEPVVVHVITKKGKGYINAEKNPSKFHGIGPFDRETGNEISSSKGISYSNFMGDYLVKLARENENIVAITAAMTEGTGLKNFAKEFPNRCFDVGIAEQHAVTFSAGLAKSGIKPFVCIYSSFLQRAYDQILHDVAIQNLPVVFMIDRAGLVGADGETHHGVFDLSYLSTVPNMTILTPYDAISLQKAMDYSLSLSSPCAIRYPRGVITEKLFCNEDNPNMAYRVKLLSVGNMAVLGNNVAEKLNEKGISAKSYPISVVKPIEVSYDFTNLDCDVIVTIEDNVINGGFGQKIKAHLSDENVKVINFAWPDAFIKHGSFEQLAKKHGMDLDHIVERICETIEGKA